MQIIRAFVLLLHIKFIQDESSMQHNIDAPLETISFVLLLSRILDFLTGNTIYFDLCYKKMTDVQKRQKNIYFPCFKVFGKKIFLGRGNEVFGKRIFFGKLFGERFFGLWPRLLPPRCLARSLARRPTSAQQPASGPPAPPCSRLPSWMSCLLLRP